MNGDLGFSATAYGFGVGIFFVGYALFEVPSNLMLARFGARRWIARIMITWGVIASAMMFVRTPPQFYTLRFLLGLAEAGFFPGIVYYLAHWFPPNHRARALSRFIIAVPVAGAFGNPVSALLLGLSGRLSLAGWQWLFVLEGIPSVLLGLAAIKVLTDRPEDAYWLSSEQRTWLAECIRRGEEQAAARHVTTFRVLAMPIAWMASAVYFLVMVPNYAYLFWAPLIVRDSLHTSDTQTGFVTGAIGLAAVFGLLAIGASSDRTQRRFAHMLLACALAAIGYLGAALLPSPVARISCLTLIFIGVQGFGISFWCIPPKLMRGSAAAAFIALVNSLGNIGGFAGSYMVGAFKDATGGTVEAFLVLAGISIAAAMLTLVFRRRVARMIGVAPAGVDGPAGLVLGAS
jgi:ACS family tartrate transporter-like MFS transporter